MFRGSIAALVTPFRSGEVDYPKLEELVERLIDAGIDGLVPCGTTGESATLTFEEHEKVVETVIRRADGRVPVIAGTGSNSTREAIELTRHAGEAGADGALLITPYYNRPTQEGLFRHYARIAEAVDLPLILYNVPSRTGVNLDADTVARLAEFDSIVAIKEASGRLDLASEIMLRADIELLSGDDSLTLPLLALGASGVISVAANAVPRAMADMVDLFREGDIEGARRIHFRLFPLFKALFIETNPVPIKEALAMTGFMEAEVRLPLCPMTDANRRKLEAVVQAVGLELGAAQR
ncbi:MAG: 4-hydroxy-tetrahydrodipicolinate synthase [Planctomycetes bacterium]|nr:4-hydroxy-tetrahydrodipicolinate synthase [Planctomycetota bacterium]